ncbi:DarT ssDNA thymidine ADP-ribosyltransferase family protein [Marivita sp. S2033]|uniref:DarT ssDNA thymidine ADP-ribosyltransferase family protein n=1 Tax=Marivita sp. S2033 TaxID=3373187 RepID=UPI0039822170
MNIWKKLFRKNADEMYEEALRAEHSAPKRYKKLISDASVLGHIDAQLRYGKELVRGGFGDGHKVEGLKWLQQAAKHGNSEAWFTIGMMYKDGHLISQDYQEASRMFAKAADSGHTVAQLELGYLYFKGLGVSQSNQKALKLYRGAAENGSANACFNIGLMYWKGEGVETDLSSARRWLEKAQSLGNPRAEGVLILIGEQQKIMMQDAMLQAAALSGWNAGIRGTFGDFQRSSDGLGGEEISEKFNDETRPAEQGHQDEQLDDSSTDQPSSSENYTNDSALPKPFLDQELVSTSALGRIIGVKAKPFLFDEFLSQGYIERSENRYLLTSFGQSAEVGGCYRLLSDGNQVVTWPVTLGASLQALKQSFLDRVDFRLFHMTHIDNLLSILQHGLLSHNKAPNYLDISNPDVNSRRERTDPVHKCSLHEYVPLYFNPRNAMLYEKQAEYRSDIVLLEATRRVCLSNYTLFTERNAAANRCRFAYCLSDVEKFDWPSIHSPNWATDGVVHVDKKQLMMSECLVYGHIDTEDLVAVHSMNTSTSSKLQSMLTSAQHPSICISPSLFF